MTPAAASSPHDTPDHEELERRMADLRLVRSRISVRLLRNTVDFLARGIMRWHERRRKAAAEVDGDDDEPHFVSVDVSSLPSSLLNHPPPSSDSPDDSQQQPIARPIPDDPAESERVAPLPAAAAAWRRAAEHTFRAGTQSPVEFPLPEGSQLPSPGAGRVFFASNHRSSTSLPAAHRAFLARKTAEELVTGGVHRIKDWSEVAAILPMFVVERELEDGSLKLRVIFDGRALNRLLAPAKGSVSYDNVRDALTVGAYCTKLDIEAAFRNVPVGPESRKYLCFEVEGRLYGYRALPFGVSWSPALFVRALEPVVQRLRDSGLRLIWYVDDILVVADTVSELDQAVARTIDALLDSGWPPSPSKTFPYAYSSIVFLGLQVSFADGRSRLSVPTSKANRIRSEALAMVCARTVHVSRLQRLAGRLSFVTVVVPQVGFLRRGIDAAIGDGLKAMHGCLPVVDRLKQDLLAVAAAAKDFPSFSVGFGDDATQRQLGLVYSDASATGWGALHVHPGAPMLRIPDVPEFDSAKLPPRGWTVGRTFSPVERLLPSGAREVLAVVGGVTALDLRDGAVAWHVDATVAASAISHWRTKSNAVAAALRDLWDTLRLRKLRLHVSHVYRSAELMPVADFLSRRAWRERQAEWQFPKANVPQVLSALRIPHSSTPQFGDLFASRRNHLFPSYASRWAEPGSLGDAFHLEWRQPSIRFWWAFPPISQVERLVLRLNSLAVAGAANPSTAQPPPPPINILLVYPASPSLSSIIPTIRRLARRDVLLCSSNPSSSSPSGQGILPNLRLLSGDGRPAPSAPPWPLRAAWLRVP